MFITLISVFDIHIHIGWLHGYYWFCIKINKFVSFLEIWLFVLL
jgi:hypothetical protein